MKKLFLSLLVIFSFSFSLFAQSHFSTVWSGNGLDHMNFYVINATINGVDMEPGDEIGVFDGGVCRSTGQI